MTNKTTAIVDIESDNLLLDATTIHCIGVKLLTDAKPRCYTSRPIKGSDGSLNDCMELLKSCDKVVFHNGIKFDIPCIKNILGVNLWDYCVVDDTLIMSQLAYPNMIMIDSNNRSLPPKLKGSHGLKAWGYRLGEYKGNYGEAEDAWDKLTPEMVEYCKQDVVVTEKLYNRLSAKDIPAEALWLEYNFARIIQRQEEYGVYFDMEKARKLHIELLEEKDRATEELLKTFTPLRDWKPLTEHPEYNQDGKTKNKNRIKQIALGAHYNDNMEWGRWEEVHFNPSSRQHIARWLQEVYHWKPTVFTEKGSIVINEDILNSLDFHEGKILAHYFNVNKLLGQLAEGDNAWMKHVRADGRIHGQVNTLGAVSRRCTHSNPNMAQVPSGRAYKGEACRELFCAPKGKKLVGCDMSGLELRVFAHFLAKYDGGAYAKVILTSDIHVFNQQAFEVSTRDMAKTTIYGTLYGAGVDKIGQIVGGGAKEGVKIKKAFERNVPAYAKLLQSVQAKVKQCGYLRALDGNKFFIRSEHSALNTLLQGTGALICKRWLIEADIALQKAGYIPLIDYEFVLNVHDEFTTEVREDIAEDVAKIIQNSCITAGKKLGIRIPTEGEAKIGRNWYDIH